MLVASRRMLYASAHRKIVKCADDDALSQSGYRTHILEHLLIGTCEPVATAAAAAGAATYVGIWRESLHANSAMCYHFRSLKLLVEVICIERTQHLGTNWCRTRQAVPERNRLSALVL
jgi:hypothetical protein